MYWYIYWAQKQKHRKQKHTILCALSCISLGCAGERRWWIGNPVQRLASHFRAVAPTVVPRTAATYLLQGTTPLPTQRFLELVAAFRSSRLRRLKYGLCFQIIHYQPDFDWAFIREVAASGSSTYGNKKSRPGNRSQNFDLWHSSIYFGSLLSLIRSEHGIKYSECSDKAIQKLVNGRFRERQILKHEGVFASTVYPLQALGA